jgi:AraC-like DNA-binding protein
MAMVRAAVIAGFDNQVRLLGADPDKILCANGFTSGFCSAFDPDELLPYDRVEQLLQAAADATNCPHFAALLGTRQNINLLGVVGHLMLQSSDVGTALLELIDHLLLHVNGPVNVALQSFGDQSYLSYHSASHSELRKHSDELAMAHSIIIMQALCGLDWKPTRVCFCHEAPSDLRLYQTLFKAPVLFGQERTEIVFPKRWLKESIIQADPALNMILRSHINQLEEEIPRDLCDDVVCLIRELLPLGPCGIETVADRLAVHPRTLQRMLKEQGSSFSDLLESVRQSIASDRLRNSNISIIQLADYLGYADNTAFTRAFKRWFGSTPRAWRKSVNSTG